MHSAARASALRSASQSSRFVQNIYVRDPHCSRAFHATGKWAKGRKDSKGDDVPDSKSPEHEESKKVEEIRSAKETVRDAEEKLGLQFPPEVFLKYVRDIVKLRESNAHGKEINPSVKEVQQDAGKREEGEQTVPAVDDTEELSRKYQRAKDVTRRYGMALKRAQRRNISQDLPPFVIPDWFLKARVYLREDVIDSPALDTIRDNGFTIKLQDKISGQHATLALPLLDKEKGIHVIDRLGSDIARKKFDDEEREKLKDALGKQGYKQSEIITQEDGESSKPLEDHGQYDAERRQSQKLGIHTSNLSPFIATEIRATILACLSTASADHKLDFPSLKTNLRLIAGGELGDHELSEWVMGIAAEMGADTVVLDAQDLALLAGDYADEEPQATPDSIGALGYQTYVNQAYETAFNSHEEDGYGDASQEPQEEVFIKPVVIDVSKMPAFTGPKFSPESIDAIRRKVIEHMSKLPEPPLRPIQRPNWSGRVRSSNDEQVWDLKLSALLEALVDSNHVKRTRNAGRAKLESKHRAKTPSKAPSPGATTNPLKFFDYSAQPSELDFTSALPEKFRPTAGLKVAIGKPSHLPRLPPKSKIIFVKDISKLERANEYGSRIIQKLESLVERRRMNGENVILIGTAAEWDLNPFDGSFRRLNEFQTENPDSYSRTIFVHGTKYTLEFERSRDGTVMREVTRRENKHSIPWRDPDAPMKKLQINMRHIQDLLRRLDPSASAKIVEQDLVSSSTEFSFQFALHLPNRLLKYDEVHRIALTALGLHLLHPSSPHINWGHVFLASALLSASDRAKLREKDVDEKKAEGTKAATGNQQQDDKKQKMRRRSVPSQFLGELQAEAAESKRDEQMASSVVDPDKIKTTFDQVHLAKDTIEAIRTLTSLSLHRPDAFKYGVLATDMLSGVLLYGPPGTGKTLLAKAVAKESGARMMQISPSQINHKYVGEGEKAVSSLFKVAQKSSPCIVFLDEADSILGQRHGGRERAAHREIINQFLQEWDGLNDRGVFVMVATNRPFDLDDAVIRRLPRRLLVDLPTKQDRKEILKIHLRDEQLDDAVDLDELAKQTPLYSGSDLKNLAVSAALACVREENEQAALAAAKATLEMPPETETPSESSSSSTSSSPAHLVPGTNYTFPEKRILRWSHFEKAMNEISASISEDTGSLVAIKKWDEKFGDKRGRTQKTPFGFGNEVQTSESSVRVRK